MSKLFKTTLVAVAVASAACVANAGTLTGATINFSTEGANAATTATTPVTFTHTVNAGFAVNDLITFTLPTGSVLAKGFTWQSTISYAAGTGTGAGGGTMVATLLDASTIDAPVYRVTTKEGGSALTTIGATSGAVAVTLANKAFGSDVSLSVKSTLANGVTEIDPGTKTLKFVDSKSQFGALKVASGSQLDATISVAKAREGFTDSETSDAFTWTHSNDTTLTGAVTVSKQVMTVNGDFDGFAKTNFTTGNTATVAVAADYQSVAITYASAITNDTVTITPPVDSKTTSAVVLEEQDFSVSGVITYGTTSTSIGSADAGEWKLDGAAVTVPYMPYGSTISQVMYITNSGALDADITVDAMDEDGTAYSLGSIGTAKKKGVTKVAGLVKAALEAQGFTGGKVALTFTVNAEDKDISVYAAYNVAGDRATVLNSQYKGK
jgi:hypothetical protein